MSKGPVKAPEHQKRSPALGRPGFSTLTSRSGPRALGRRPAISDRFAKNAAAGRQVPPGAKQKKPGLGIAAGLPLAVGKSSEGDDPVRPRLSQRLISHGFRLG